MIELMGGSIRVESEIGQGSRFFFTIELALGDAGQIATEPMEEKQDLGLRGAKILLVEDNELNQELAIALLEREGVLVTSVWNGQEALEMLQKEHFDGVLMDMQMPVMDGYTATREIRKWEKETGVKDTPIIALTAYALTEELRKSIEAGCNGHITKPVKKAKLIESIQEHFTNWNRS